MIGGFFSAEETKLTTERMPSAPLCGSCKLKKKGKKNRTQVAIRGNNKKGIIIIVDSETLCSDDHIRVLKGLFKQVGIHLLKDCLLIPSTRCNASMSASTGGANQCRPFVYKELKNTKTKVIITIGSGSLLSIIGHKWKKGLGEIHRWIGRMIPNDEFNCFVCPLLPIEMLDTENKMYRPVAKMNAFMWVSYLKNIKAHMSDPFYEGHDFKPQEECFKIMTETEGQAALSEMLEKGKGVVAFDYETNCLKPQAKTSKLYSVGFATDPNTCFAFTTKDKKTLKKIKKVLANKKIKKIGANMKFEEHWSRCIIGTPVLGWLFDVCLGAHIEDQREGITSVKFQACVRLGVYDYSEHITPMLKSEEKGCYSINRIEQIPVKDLLRYNAFDALIEYRLGVLMAPKMGVKI